MEALVALGFQLVGSIVSTIKAAREKGDEAAIAAAYAELADLLSNGAVSADARATAHRETSAKADAALVEKFDATDNVDETKP